LWASHKTKTNHVILFNSLVNHQWYDSTWLSI
jgi:hypothetical protein